MTATEHPSDEQLADLGAGSLPADEAMRVNAHVARCSECSDHRDAIADVTALLAQVGRMDDQPMPTDVAASLQAALSAEVSRRAFVPARGDTPLPQRRRRAPRWLAGAAAAVVLTSAGVAAWQVLPHSGSDYTADSGSGPVGADVGQQEVVPGGSAGQGKGPLASAHSTYQDHPGGQLSFRTVQPSTLADTARGLAARPPGSTAADVSPCATPAVSGPREVIRWHGRPAVLAVQPDVRSAAILDCATARRVLFTATY